MGARVVGACVVGACVVGACDVLVKLSWPAEKKDFTQQFTSKSSGCRRGICRDYEHSTPSTLCSHSALKMLRRSI